MLMFWGFKGNLVVIYRTPQTSRENPVESLEDEKEKSQDGARMEGMETRWERTTGRTHFFLTMEMVWSA